MNDLLIVFLHLCISLICLCPNFLALGAMCLSGIVEFPGHLHLF